MQIRIKDYALTLADLVQYPMWKYALDEEVIEGQDERTVKPFQTTANVNLQNTYLILRTSFYLANGKQFKGYIRSIRLEVDPLMKAVLPYDLNPVIINEMGRVYFCYGSAKPDQEEMSRNYSLLGFSPTEVFPIKFVADVQVDGYVVEGTLDGFLYFDEEQEDFFNLKQEDMKIVR
jgi:hypothetical protein